MLDIHILAEELGGRALCGHRGAVPRLNLRSARIWQDACPLESDIIYVMDASDVRRLSDGDGAEPSGATLAIAGDFGVEPAPGGADAIQLEDVPSAQVALSRIQDVFERYEALEKRMYNAVIAGQSVGAVLRMGAERLVNPIALFDASYSLLAEAGTFPEGGTDAIWDEVRSKGYTTLQHSGHEWLRRMQESPEPLIEHSDGITTIQTCIHVGDRIVGYLGATELVGPFTEGQRSLVSWLRRMLEEFWPAFERAPEQSGISNQIVFELAAKMPVSLESVEDYLAQRGWEREGSYRLLDLYRAQGPLTGIEANLLRREMEALFPLDIVVRIEGGVLAAVREDRDEDGDRMERKRGGLRELVEREGLQCAASETMTDFMDLGRAFAQCRAVRSVIERREPGAMATMGQVARPYLMDALNGAVDLDDICSPAVRSLHERNNGDALVESLRVYIMHGRSLAHAAQELHVHRNTLMYRVDQIEKHLGVDLGELSEDELFYLYLSCLIVEDGRPVARMDGRPQP